MKLVTRDEDKVEVLNKFCLSLQWKPVFHPLKWMDSRIETEGKKVIPTIRKDQV